MASSKTGVFFRVDDKNGQTDLLTGSLSIFSGKKRRNSYSFNILHPNKKIRQRILFYDQISTQNERDPKFDLTIKNK